ncbi:MAG: DUF309 domain-containing protein [Anaerolineae bacterium]|nr:DUF309 domain-containing protein [Anaerolineae bacterium]
MIVISGSPAWSRTVDHIAASLTGVQLIICTEQAGYVARLATDGAGLILVDGDRADWRFWATTPKASPATRRIPVVVVSGQAEVRAEALRAGADVSLAPDMLGTELQVLIRNNAHRLSVEEAARLEAQCAEPLPARAREAIERFNAGEYYAQHDLFEAQWMEESGPVRDLYRAILQVGVAYYQVKRSNRRGALKMLLRSFQWLNALPDTCQGVDIRSLRADALRVREALDALPEGDDLSAFDRSLLRPVRLID